MDMSQSISPEADPEPQQLTETQRELFAVEGIVRLARAMGVRTEDQFEDVAFEVMNLIYTSQAEYEPGEEVVRCAREQLARTTGLLACEKSVSIESSAPPVYLRHGAVPC